MVSRRKEGKRRQTNPPARSEKKESDKSVNVTKGGGGASVHLEGPLRV